MGKVCLGNIEGIWYILIKTSDDCCLLLKHVRYVQDFRMNLISTWELDDVGYNVVFGEGGK